MSDINTETYTIPRALGRIAAELQGSTKVKPTFELYRTPQGGLAFPIELLDGRKFLVTIVDERGEPAKDEDWSGTSEHPTWNGE